MVSSFGIIRKSCILSTMKKGLAILIVVLILSASRSSAQQTEKEKAGFVYGRIKYHLLNSGYGRQPREVAWHHDYPYGDEQFVTVAKELTSVNTNREAYEVVDIDSKDLFRYPFVYLCEPG